MRVLPLGYVWSSERAAFAHATGITNLTVGGVAQELGIDLNPMNRRGKTGVGDITQRYMGKARDNRREPDIAELGIEIKSIPILKGKRGWRVKEPTSVTQIDADEVAAQDWPTAYVRAKLARILWFPYEYRPELEKGRFLRPFLWSPSTMDLHAFEEDYQRVRNALRTTAIADISEGTCRVLRPRRKDSKGGTRRAWSLKQSFTFALVQRYSLYANLSPIAPVLDDPRTLEAFEARVEARLGKYVGKTLAEIARATGAKIVGGKAGPATFVRKLLGDGRGGSIEEFKKYGIRVQTVWADPRDYSLHEQVSLPAMSLKDFAAEDWDRAELREHIDRLLLIPLFSETRQRDARRLGRAFFWSPSEKEWAKIHDEWERYRREVAAGKAAYRSVLDAAGRPRFRNDGKPLRENGLTKSSKTECIHIRPHALDSHDEDEDPLGNPVTGQSFWLNGSFLARILSDHHHLLR